MAGYETETLKIKIRSHFPLLCPTPNVRQLSHDCCFSQEPEMRYAEQVTVFVRADLHDIIFILFQHLANKYWKHYKSQSSLA